MKIYIMTDMEGTCGITNFADWVVAGARYYEEGKKLLTMEVNAAVEGFYTAGATEIYVADGHGAGGINQLLLDSRTSFISGSPGPFPFMLDSTFDAIAWIGQHAKSGTEFAHLPHTGWFDVLDFCINGRSIGEFGQMALCASSLGIRSIFCSGDEAMAKEATQLISGIEAVSVKRGTMPGMGGECTTEEYMQRNLAANHMHPSVACRLIKQKSEAALLRFIHHKESFELPDMKPPFHRVVRYRSSAGNPPYETDSVHETSLIKLLNTEQRNPNA